MCGFGSSQPTLHESQSFPRPRPVRASVDSRSDHRGRARWRSVRRLVGLCPRLVRPKCGHDARAMQRANQALLLDPNQATAHYTKARLIIFRAKPNDAASANEIIAQAEASLRADPSFAGAYWAMANGEMLLGRHEQGMSNLEQAMRISPRDSSIGVWHMDMGRDLLALRRPDAAAW
jgi:tetratricopeptide (TPR) repeat protein